MIKNIDAQNDEYRPSQANGRKQIARSIEARPNEKPIRPKLNDLTEIVEICDKNEIDQHTKTFGQKSHQFSWFFIPFP